MNGNNRTGTSSSVKNAMSTSEAEAVLNANPEPGKRGSVDPFGMHINFYN